MNVCQAGDDCRRKITGYIRFGKFCTSETHPHTLPHNTPSHAHTHTLKHSFMTHPHTHTPSYAHTHILTRTHPGMELYASALWHLQQEVELSVLAESLHSSAPLRPEGLSAMASVMNLAKDHESAVKFLQRAIKVRKANFILPRLCAHYGRAARNGEGLGNAFRWMGGCLSNHKSAVKRQ